MRDIYTYPKDMLQRIIHLFTTPLATPHMYMMWIRDEYKHTYINDIYG